MDEAKQQLVDKLKSANNVLVTVSRDPSVDQLAACLGLALLLNKQAKHTVAVFSGQVPSTLEFLQPEDTLEKNTDSLRDFIIALDKSKADKLRYKVEDDVVRIFITPYKTSISQDDLEFSQGDFNVDLVIALGVAQQEDLDEAITAHGRILHDATVASINTSAEGGLGSINWHDPQASSLSELVTELTQAVGSDLLDSQIATALLTGIVSATDRFSNDKTSSQTMNISATLMAAGANQQLVASKLEEPDQPAVPAEGDQPGDDSENGKPDDGTIEIEHNDEPASDEPSNENPALELPTPDDSKLPADDSTNSADDSASLVEDKAKLGSEELEPPVEQVNSTMSPGSKLVTGPPSLGGTLTANAQQEVLDPVTDPFSLPDAEPPQLLERKPTESSGFTPPPTDWTPPVTPVEPPITPALPAEPSVTPPAADDQPAAEPSLEDLEEQVKVTETEPTELNDVRDKVSRALNSSDAPNSPAPIQALNAQPLGTDLHPDELVEQVGPVQSTPPTPSLEEQIPGLSGGEVLASDSPQVSDVNAPPPVPPPIPFQFGNPPKQQ